VGTARDGQDGGRGVQCLRRVFRSGTRFPIRDSTLGVQKTDASQKTSAATTGALLSGQNVPLHQVMIASEEASVSFQLMLEVRNKLLDGYQELMRMQV
jgi:hypothetical protein